MTCTRCGTVYWENPIYGNYLLCDGCMGDSYRDMERANAEIRKREAREAYEKECREKLRKAANSVWE